MCSYELQWSEAPGKRSKRCVISMSSAQNRSPSDKGERITFIWWIVHELGQSVKHGTVPPHLIILLKKRQMPVSILTHYCIVVNSDSVTAITLYAVWHGLKRCISPLFFFFFQVLFSKINKGHQRSSKILLLPLCPQLVTCLLGSLVMSHELVTFTVPCAPILLQWADASVY